MFYFQVEKGNAITFTVSIKSPDKLSDVWFKLVEEHKRCPLEFLKVVPGGDKGKVLEVTVSPDAAERVKNYLPKLGCCITSQRSVTTARPILASSQKEVVVLPAITGVFDSDIEYT